MAALAQREESASLSLSYEEDEDHPAPLMNTQHLPAPTAGPKLKASETQANRNQFLRCAPSLMKLITVAQTPKPSSLFEQSSFPDTAEEEAAEVGGHRTRSAHIKMPTVINNVLNEFEKHNNDTDELQQLALKAAKEFQILAAKNDALFREKEQFRTKYDDTRQTVQELEEKVGEAEIYREENEKLQSINSSLAVQIKVFSQEKAILEETMNDLKRKEFERRSSSQENIDSATSKYASIASAVNVVKRSENEERLMAQVSQITKEKNDMEAVFESFKAEIDAKNENVTALQQQLTSANDELARLRMGLSQTTDKYIALEQKGKEKRHEYKRKLTIQSESIYDEHVAKQKELAKVIATQKKRICELEDENQELTSYKFKKRESKKMNHLRLRTKQDVFNGGDLYDMDPFGGDDDDEDDGYIIEQAGSGLSEDDDEGPTFHDNNDGIEPLPADSTNSTQDGFILPANRDSVGEQMQINSGKCACFTSIFSKHSNNIQRLSNSEPLAVQEMR